MGSEIWYLTGDGRKVCCSEGSVAHGLMEKDGTFTLIEIDGEPQPASVKDAAADPGSMKKAELIAYAKERGIEVNPKATVKAILEVIRSAEAGAEAEPEAEAEAEAEEEA